MEEFEKLNSPEDEAEAVKKTYPSVMEFLKLMKPGESASKYHPKGSYFNQTRIGLYASCTITATRQQFHPYKDRLLTIPEVKFLT